MSIVLERMKKKKTNKTPFHSTQYVPWHLNRPGSIFSICWDVNYCAVCSGPQKTIWLLVTKKKKHKQKNLKEREVPLEVCLFPSIYPPGEHVKKNGGKDSIEMMKWVLQLNHE